MSKESLEPNFRGESVTINQAWAIVWRAGNMALNRVTDPYVQGIVANEVGRMFGKIEEVQELSEIVKEELPDSGPITFTLGSIMMGMDYRKNLIYQGESQPNPFLIHDDELAAINSLSLYIETAYNDTIQK